MQWLLVFAGCGLGGVCRYALSQTLRSVPGHFPWATFVANMVGSLLIGLLLGALTKRPSQVWQCLCVTGFCGGFTTFSTFANETLQLLRQGSVWLAAGYAGLSVVAGLACVATGFVLARLG